MYRTDVFIPRGEGRVGWAGRSGLTYMHYYVWNRSLMRTCCTAHELCLVLCGDLNGREIQNRDTHIQIADSLLYTAEANTTLQSNSTPITMNKICFENEKKKKSAYWGRNVHSPLRGIQRNKKWLKNKWMHLKYFYIIHSIRKKWLLRL